MKKFVARKKYGFWVVYDTQQQEIVEKHKNEKSCKNRVRDLNKLYKP